MSTDHERAIQVAHSLGYRTHAVMEARIEDALRAARADEREACAKIADARYDPNNLAQTAVCSAVADAIRTRR